MNIFKFWKSFLFGHLRLWEGEGGGGEGDGGDKAFTQTDLDSAITKAVDGLKTKNSELLGNLNKVSERLKLFGDIEPEKVKEMLAKLEADDDKGLLKEGKIDELVAKRVDKITQEFEAKISVITGERDDFEGKYKTSDQRFNDHVVSESIFRRAVDAGVRKEALDDVVSMARGIFTIGDDNEPEARDDEGALRKLGDKLFTADNWIESLKESKPHYWPESRGAGAQGAQGDKGGKTGDVDAQVQAAAAAGDHAEFRKLRKLQLEARKKA